jgi:hypothetical protein
MCSFSDLTWLIAALSSSRRLLTPLWLQPILVIEPLIAPYPSAHVSRETTAWLAAQPPGRFTFTFTPWLNLIEGFFSKLARSCFAISASAPDTNSGAPAGLYRRPQSRTDPPQLALQNRQCGLIE